MIYVHVCPPDIHTHRQIDNDELCYQWLFCLQSFKIALLALYCTNVNNVRDNTGNLHALQPALGQNSSSLI